MSFYVSTVIVKIEQIENSNAILLSGHSNGKILFYAFLAWSKNISPRYSAEIKANLQKILMQKKPFDLISTGVQTNANHLVDMNR